MQVYIAGSFSNKENIEKICKKIEDAGANVTNYWWSSKVKDIDVEDELKWYELDSVKVVFGRNFRSAVVCDLFILVFNPDGERLQGALVELGIAYSFKDFIPKRIVALGSPPSRSAMYCCIDKFYDDIDELIKSEILELK